MPPTHHNPLAAHLSRRHRPWPLLPLTAIALAAGLVILRGTAVTIVYDQTYYRLETLTTRLALASLLVALIVPASIAAFTTLRTTDYLASGEYILLLLTPIPNAEIVTGFVQAAIHRFRTPLTLLITLTPPLALGRLFYQRVAQIDTLCRRFYEGALDAYYDQCQVRVNLSPSYVIEQPFSSLAVWLAGEYLLLAAILLGLCLLGIILSICLSLWWRSAITAPPSAALLTLLVTAATTLQIVRQGPQWTHPAAIWQAAPATAALLTFPWAIAGVAYWLARLRVRLK